MWNRIFVVGALCGVALGCGGAHGGSAPKSVSPQVERVGVVESDAVVAEAHDTLCGMDGGEAAVVEEVLERSGRGLLWLVARDEEQEWNHGGRLAPEQAEEGAEAIRSGRQLAECLMAQHEEGFAAASEKGIHALESWVDAVLVGKHPHTLLAAGASYFASVLVADSSIDAVLEVPASRLFLERLAASDPHVYDGLGALILGAYECYVPQPIGGQPRQGLARLEAGADLGGRFTLPMKVAAAELCAFSLQDRAVFERHIGEVLAANVPADAIFAQLAQQRARALLPEADELFSYGSEE